MTGLRSSRSAQRVSKPLAAAVGLALLTGCGSTPAPAHNLAASTTQFRPQEGTDILRTGVTNLGHAPVRIGTADLVWPGFASRPVTVDQSVVAGDTAAFDLRYGAPRCAVLPARKAQLRVEVDGHARALPLEVQDSGLLLRLWRRACATSRLDSIATVRLATGRLTRAGYRTAVVLTRQPGAAEVPVTLVDVGGSVILELVADHLPARLSGARLRVPLLIHPSLRCDPHSLSQSQQTFLLSAYVRRASDPVVRVFLRQSPAVRASLQQMIDRDCT